MKVINILPRLKANRYTYYNLDKKTISDFKKLYNYLKKHKTKYIYKNIFQNYDALQGSINFWLDNSNEMEFIRKYKAMELISTNIDHK